MRLYARNELVRSRQIIGDALVAAWVVGWVVVGRALHDLVATLADAGRVLEDAGDDFARSAGGAGSRVDDLPVLGDRLAEPFDAVAAGGATVARAGVAQQDAVMTLALVLGTLLALLPIVWLLARYLPRRLRWVRQAAAADALIAGGAGDVRLFALRALANRPLHELRRVSDDPVGAFERGDPTVVRALAAVELRPLGLAVPGNGGAMSRR